VKLLAFLFRQSPGLLALAVGAGVLSGASSAALLALINQAIHAQGPATTRAVGSFAALCLMLPVAGALSSYVLSILGQRTILRLREQLIRKTLSVPLRKLEEIGPHRLLAVLTQDIASIVGAISALPLLMIQTAMVGGGLVYLAALSRPVLGAVLVVLSVGIVTYQLPVRIGSRYHRQAREESDRLYQHFRDLIGGAKELQLHHPRQNALLARIDTTGLTLRRLAVASATVYSLAGGWGQMIMFGLIGAIVFALPLYIPVETSALSGYAIVLLAMLTPLDMILANVPTLARARVSMRKMEALGLSIEESDERASGGRSEADAAPSPDWCRLELVGVTHTYRSPGDDHDFVLGPVDLSIGPAEIVFLVGGNGSGKTTLAKLLLGLYIPESGEIRFAGRVVTEANRAWYRQHFSVVFSDFHLFEDLLAADPGSVDLEAARYLARLELDHKVKVQDGRLSSTDLSQGQRKRLALLAAYLENRPIYVFDEWAADQDAAFRELFYLQLLPELRARGKAVVVISHDERYYAVADRTFKLEYGQVVSTTGSERPFAPSGAVPGWG
jgi:putative ATP-binding cassette transporter